MNITLNPLWNMAGLIYLAVSVYMFLPLTGHISVGQISMAAVFFVVVLTLAYKDKGKFKFDIGSFSWSLIFGFFQAINKSFALDYSLAFYNKNFSSFVWQMIIGVLFSYPLFYLGKFYMKQRGRGFLEPAQKGSYIKFNYLQILFLFLAVWLTIIYFQLPISISNDAVDQLRQFASFDQLINLKIPLNNHHPIFDTMILGTVFKIGLHIHNSFSFGILFIAVVQTIFTAVGFAFVTFKLFQSRVSILLKYFFSCMMLFSPMWINLNITIVKDNLLIAPLIFWFYFYSQLIVNRKKMTNTLLGIFLLLSIIVSLMRPNTFYVIAFSLLSLLLLKDNLLFRLKIASILFFTVITVVGYNKIITKTGVIPAKNVEMLSIPLQQTARTIKYNNVSLSKEEQKVLGDVIAPDSIEKYNPQVSDPIKGSYNWNGKNAEFNEKFKAFLPIWVKIGRKYPKAYFEATYANVFGYIDVINRDSGQGQVLFTNYAAASQITDTFDLKKEYMSQEEVNTKNKLSHNFIELLNSPIINIYQNLGLWTWFLIYIFVSGLFHFKLYKREMLLVFPSVLTLATLFLSPVNGLNRYYVPIFLMLPIIITSLKTMNTKLEEINE